MSEQSIQRVLKSSLRHPLSCNFKKNEIGGIVPSISRGPCTSSIFMKQQLHLGPSSSTNVRNDSSVRCSLMSWNEMQKIRWAFAFRVHLPARFFKTILAYLDVIFMRSICIKFLVLFIASYGSWRHTTYHQAHTMIARLNIHQTNFELRQGVATVNQVTNWIFWQNK